MMEKMNQMGVNEGSEKRCFECKCKNILLELSLHKSSPFLEAENLKKEQGVQICPPSFSFMYYATYSFTNV